MSFINTGGFESPVMPSVQFANPAYFGQAGPAIMQGALSGFKLGQSAAEAKREAQMAPLRQQLAQFSVAEAPTQMQLLQAQAGKASLPVPVVTSTKPVQVRRDTGEVVTPDMELPAGTQVDTLSQEQGFTHNLLTGEQTPFTRFGEKPLMTAEEAEKEHALSQFYGVHGESLMDTAQARRIAAENSAVKGNRPYVAQGDDGKPHLFRTMADPATGEQTENDLGVASEAVSKMELEGAKAGQAKAAATRPAYMPKSEYQARKNADAAVATQLDPGTYSLLLSTDDGAAALDEWAAHVSAQKKGFSTAPVSPQTLQIISKARQQAEADGVAPPVAGAAPGATVNPLLRSMPFLNNQSTTTPLAPGMPTMTPVTSAVAPPVAAPVTAPTSMPPQAAINQLLASPELAPYFDQKYGAGMAEQYMRAFGPSGQ